VLDPDKEENPLGSYQNLMQEAVQEGGWYSGCWGLVMFQYPMSY
jgi:hypothetical protein